MPARLAPFPRFKALDQNAGFLAGGKLWTFIAGTTTPKPTYTDQSGATANQNPVILDGSGEADVWLTSGAYKFLLTDINDVPQWTVDNIEAQPSDIVADTLTVGSIAISGVLTSSVLSVAPFVIASSVVVPNLNAGMLQGGTWAAPLQIGSITPNLATFSIVTATNVVADGVSGHVLASGGAFGNFQVGDKITHYNGRTLLGEGVANMSAIFDALLQSLAIPSFNLMNTTLEGMYRVSYYLYLTTAGNAVNLTGTIGWNNGAAAKSVTTANIACNTLGADSSLIGQAGSITFWAPALQAITFATALSGAIGAGVYGVHVRVEFLG